ncbi:DUF3027 domain-containing protein [Microbacterium trichothecenolyticum]|uniref:DUF3027 domain-containing protein n=1 Tax=Microbacterium trichothecenolyticum TaxID=69370 RepID=UPI001C6E12B4|nr:DUF3027 domain-containing protein [Microbacterium trichothecenolyticum]MBW9120844.1 DUF3027 domain-containing protein [Microbacterium trichothecenolyticum]
MSSTPEPTDPVVDVVIDAEAASDEPVTDAAAAAAEKAPVVEDDAAEQTDGAPGEGAPGEALEPPESSETAEVVEIVEVVVPAEPDPQLLAAHDLALAALREITPEATIGDPAGYRVEADGVVSLRFANRLAGYPGWFWTVSLARVEDAKPTVLEVELLPGDGALLAPDWVPWAVRLADYHAAQAALAEAAHADDGEEDDDDELEDVDDLDASDFDDDGSPILHAGDVDGVDIDELADAAAGNDDSGEDDDEPDEHDDFDDDEDEDEDSDDEYADEDDSDEDSDDEDDSGEEDDSDEDFEPEDA